MPGCFANRTQACVAGNGGAVARLPSLPTPKRQEPDHKGPSSISYPATPPSREKARRSVTLAPPLKRGQGWLKALVHRRRCAPPAWGLPRRPGGHRTAPTPSHPLGAAVPGDPGRTRLPAGARPSPTGGGVRSRLRGVSCRAACQRAHRRPAGLGTTAPPRWGRRFRRSWPCAVPFAGPGGQRAADCASPPAMLYSSVRRGSYEEGPARSLSDSEDTA
jgi:hypothetical protein